MNKKILLFSAALGMTYIGMTGYVMGPAASPAMLNRTGAAGSTASCSVGGCHAASSTATTAFIEMADPATPSVKVTKYTPGKTYLMTIRGISTPGKAKFGFQVAATKSDNTNGGTITATAPSTGTHTLSGITILEHNAALTSTPSAGNHTVDFNWVAPAKGAGTITFYGIINAVDGTGTTANDQPSNGVTAAFTEDAASGIGEATTSAGIRLYPNPCHSALHIEGAGNKEVAIEIINLAGRVVLNTTNPGNIDISGLAPGAYIALVHDGTAQMNLRFIKQ